MAKEVKVDNVAGMKALTNALYVDMGKRKTASQKTKKVSVKKQTKK